VHYYCWNCYVQVGTGSGRCEMCGGRIESPDDADYVDRLLWALHHPLVERRIIAARALGDRREARGLQRLQVMATDSDPYLAAAAVSALGQIGGDGISELLRRLAETGPAPVRHAARTALDEPPSS
jgi:HEAT repeat protein